MAKHHRRRRVFEPLAPPEWEGLERVWTPPEHPDIGLYHITKAADLVTWAQWIGHSGARYQKWAIDTPIWHFLTFLDKEGYPHCTIHLKDLSWLYRAHPDDDKALHHDAWDGWKPSVQRADGRARWWLKSTLYDDVDREFDRPVKFKGQVCAVMGVGHRDKDRLLKGEHYLFQLWYNDVVCPGAGPIKRKVEIE